ncbi:signal peptide peptidase-like protein, partial [Trifolium pratense]
AGLFVYDIFWVFFTPVMVSVAKSFDAPIKLLFPTADLKRPFSMLGLGDIVIPGGTLILKKNQMGRDGMEWKGNDMFPFFSLFG